GIGLVPEDRKRQGLVLMMSGRANFSLAMLKQISPGGMLRHGLERKLTESLFARLRVKTPSIAAPVQAMSGGNQQKAVIAQWLGRQGGNQEEVVIGKWLAGGEGSGGKVLIVDEPTRGVDIGAKAAIHQLLDDLARTGVAIVLISSELPELIQLSTRILVMREG